MNYKPSASSTVNEKAIKDPLIAEYNVMGAKFRAKEISSTEWNQYKKNWLKRFKTDMLSTIENRQYIEDVKI
jgi:hypothetical protein